MSADASAILDQLRAVEFERARRAADPEFAATVVQLKHYQQRRFSRTYADLLASDRYRAAATFFLDDLYGPRDFSERDAQFARVVPTLAKLFPDEIVETVRTLAELHALSERLDSTMASFLLGRPIDAAAYLGAWQRTGDAPGRERQIALTLAIGATLDRLTRKPLLRRSLHLMRAPARAAGLGDLQRFLESGFDTFREMRGAQEFLDVVGTRERSLAASLFGASVAFATSDSRVQVALGQLP